MRVAHVVGLGHGGTTILDRILSCYPGAIGLGEVDQIWKKIQRGTLGNAETCPCGRSHMKCKYWSKILGRSFENPGEFFRAMVVTAAEQKHDLVIDSSKAVANAGHYTAMRSEGIVDELIQLRLFRDPRGWVQSMVRRHEIEADDTTSIRALYWRWLFSNVKLDRKTARPDNLRVYVWYDKLIIDNAQNMLAEVIGVPLPPKGSIKLKKANQHAFTGNKFVHSKARNRLSYDASWMENKLIEEIYAGMAPVRDYYHEAQKLHLIRNGSMTHKPNVFVEQSAIDEAAASGDFTAIAEQARRLEPVAVLPDDVPERKAA